jgi:SRSO17 transposase
MDEMDFAQLASRLATFRHRFAPYFGRPEAQRRAGQYLHGLLVQQTDRRNCENLAEAVDGATARAFQKLLTESPWAWEPVITELQAFVGERLAAPEGIFVCDDTGFAKQGAKSVGVARQYSGTLGKVGNCQLGVFLAYVSARGHALVDGRLYLPPEWTADPARCRAAGVPAPDLAYQSKAELALAQRRQARARGHLTGAWVTADGGFGEVPSFRDALDAEGWHYVLEIPGTTPVFMQFAASAVPAWAGRGRQPTRPQRLAGEPAPQEVRAVAAALPPGAWQILTVAEGAQGPRTYQVAARRVWESREGIPGRACWLLLRRNLDGSELKYSLSNAPAATPLRTLGQVGASRWPIETEFQTEKGETGLDEYEVRRWVGWHHHITLALLAGAFRLQVAQEWGEKHGRGGDAAPGEPGAARAAAATAVDPPRPAGLAGPHAGAQRAGQALARQTAPAVVR